MREQAEAVQRMQDYIERHLDETITPAQLAGAAMFSPWHAYRLFKRYTSLTPAEYIRRLRLSRSALRLRDGEARVADVAFEMGFGSVDGYQRAFLRAFGQNPGQYAADPGPLRLFTPYGAKYRELRKEPGKMEKVKTVFVQQVEKPRRRAVIKRGVAAEDYFPYCEEVGCEVWGILTSIRSLDGEPKGMWLGKTHRRAGSSIYVQGVEVDADFDAPIPEGFETIELSAARYLMFQGEPFAEEDYCQAIEQVRRAVERYDPSPLGLEWDDAGPRMQLEPIGARGYIEMWPVRAKRG